MVVEWCAFGGWPVWLLYHAPANQLHHARRLSGGRRGQGRRAEVEYRLTPCATAADAPSLYVACVTHGTRTVPHRKRPHTRHASRAPGRVRRQGAERSRMHGHMYSDSLGAAAGFAPERSSLTGGVPSVSNAGVVGGVIHLAAVLRVAHVRLRRAIEMEHAAQRRVPAPRDLPGRLAMKVRPRSAPSARSNKSQNQKERKELGF